MKQVVLNKENINKLIREGVRFREIPEITNQAIEKGFIIYEEDKIILSAKGQEYLSQNEKKIKENNKDKWIDPAFKSRVAKIGKDDIFLPSQDELSF